jgi:predicted branched-subunit amino acid permease
MTGQAILRNAAGDSATHIDQPTSSSRTTHRREPRVERSHRLVAIEGARDITPMAIGVIPLAMTIGVVLSTSSLSSAQAIASGPAILAGTSQLATLRLLSDDVAAPMIVCSALLVNLRILLYGAAFAPWFEQERLRSKMLLAIPIIDQLYFTSIPRFERGDLDARGRKAYHLGAGVWLYSTWWLVQLTAYSVGPRLLAAADAVAVLAPLAMVGLVARSTTDRSTAIAGAAAVAGVWAGRGVPFNGSLVLATVVGIGLGSIVADDAERAS